jgi:hypothetical protein
MTGVLGNASPGTLLSYLPFAGGLTTGGIDTFLVMGGMTLSLIANGRVLGFVAMVVSLLFN